MIAVPTSRLSGPIAEVLVGQALQRVLVTATADGLATSFLTQVAEVLQIPDELRRLIGGTPATAGGAPHRLRRPHEVGHASRTGTYGAIRSCRRDASRTPRLAHGSPAHRDDDRPTGAEHVTGTACRTRNER